VDPSEGALKLPYPSAYAKLLKAAGTQQLNSTQPRWPLAVLPRQVQWLVVVNNLVVVINTTSSVMYLERINQKNYKN
jgi:hypothetical protein